MNDFVERGYDIYLSRNKKYEQVNLYQMLKISLKIEFFIIFK